VACRTGRSARKAPTLPRPALRRQGPQEPAPRNPHACAVRSAANRLVELLETCLDLLGNRTALLGPGTHQTPTNSRLVPGSRPWSHFRQVPPAAVNATLGSAAPLPGSYPVGASSEAPGANVARRPASGLSGSDAAASSPPKPALPPQDASPWLHQPTAHSNAATTEFRPGHVRVAATSSQNHKEPTVSVRAAASAPAWLSQPRCGLLLLLICAGLARTSTKTGPCWRAGEGRDACAAPPAFRWRRPGGGVISWPGTPPPVNAQVDQNARQGNRQRPYEHDRVMP